MARKTLATLRAGASKIRTEMEVVYTGDQNEAAILGRLLTIGHTEKSALVCYRWHYENTSAVDGTVLVAPKSETVKQAPKPVSAEAPAEDKTEEIVVSADQILADLEAEIEAISPVGNVAADKTVDHRVGA